MPSADLPSHAQVLVVGGGPAGSYAATALAREGHHVVLFEAAKFPRYHVGESLIPSARHFLRFIGAEEKLADYGFTYKPGSAIKFNQYLQEGYTDFLAIDAANNAWNVVRSEFDHLLLKHAAASGVDVYEQTRVLDVLFDDPPPSAHTSFTPSEACPSRRPPMTHRRSSTVDFAPGHGSDPVPLGRPRTVVYETAFGGKKEISFDYLIDASGRAGLLSTRYLKNRKFNASLKNVAVWGYWKNTQMYGKGTPRENAPYFEALSDESGWAWFIPLHKGVTSVGIVMDQKQLGVRSRASSSASSSPLLGSGGAARRRAGSISAHTASTLTDRYVSFLQLCPTILGLIGDGELVAVKSDEDEDAETEGPLARSASDYSYSASDYAGPGWRIVGDAGAFIDPFFSSGVHLAMTGGLSAAASIAASIRGDCSEVEAAGYHNCRVSLSYTRFLIVVLSAYKQIRSQSNNILLDIEENNFDRAFACLRPVIQGSADMGKRLTENEVQRALDFCVHLFDPTTPEQHTSARRTLESAYGNTPIASSVGLSPSLSSSRSRSKSLIAPSSEPDVARLFDVRAPVVDPAQLDRLLRLQLQLQDARPAPPSPSLASPPASGHTPASPAHFPWGHLPGSRSGSGSSLSHMPSPRVPPSIPEAALPPQHAHAAAPDAHAAEIRMVLDKVNARRVIHAEHGDALCNLEAEDLGGLVLRLERGALGLRRLAAGTSGGDADAVE